MKKICFCFQIHQPYRLRPYRFFEIGSLAKDYDNIQLNSEVFRKMYQDSYMPANQLMLELIKSNPNFKISYTISGLVIEQMETLEPSLADSFRELALTGQVEFILEPYAHSIACLYDFDEFKAQVQLQQEKLSSTFGINPSKVLCNPELIYNGEVAEYAQAIGMKAMIVDGNRPFLGGRSANRVYRASEVPELNLILRNTYLSNLIEHSFSRYDAPEYPITADKIMSQINNELNDVEDTMTIFINYETLGAKHHRDTGIFEFFRALPLFAQKNNIGFTTPSKMIEKPSPRESGLDFITSEATSSIHWNQSSLNPWRRNDLQRCVFNQLQETCEKMRICRDNDLQSKWLYLQSIDHFFYMDTSCSSSFSPYTSPYEAFTNYMNIFSDFLIHLNGQFLEDYSVGINSYEEMLQKQEGVIKEQKTLIRRLRGKVTRLEKKLEN